MYVYIYRRKRKSGNLDAKLMAVRVETGWNGIIKNFHYSTIYFSVFVFNVLINKNEKLRFFRKIPI